MKHTKKIIGLALCIALTASFAACGKSAEKVLTPEETTAASTTTAEDTTEGETTTADGTTAASTTTAGGTTTAATTTKAGETTKVGETTKAGETSEAPEDTKDTKETTAAPADETAAPTEAPTEEPTEAPTEAPAEQPKSELLFEFGGASINIGDNAQSFVGAVAPNNEESAPSCYGNGEDINYYYDDFTIYVWNENGNYLTYGIDITGTGAATSRGITVGSSVDDLKAAYGEDYKELGSDYVYTYGEYNLHFTIAGDTVTKISYNKDI